MCVRVRPEPTGEVGSVGVLSSCWCLHMCRRWACGCAQVGCLHTHICTLGKPDTYRHTPVPSYRHPCADVCSCLSADYLSF